MPKGRALLNENTGIPYIRVVDMYMGGVKLDDIMYVPLDIADKIKQYKISKDDIFIAVVGNTLGLVGEVPEELDNANLTENADKLCNIKCDKTYLSFYLQSEIMQSVIETMKTVGAQPKLALTRIAEFNIALPPLEEQLKISSIIKNINNLIENYTSQYADYTQLKEGLFQRKGKFHMSVSLCSESLARVDINVYADLICGKLKISGQDFGKVCKEYFRDDEYE